MNQEDASRFLERFFPRASVRRFAREFPAERLVWAAEETAGACGEKEIKKPASYFLRLLRDGRRWEKHLYACHAPDEGCGSGKGRRRNGRVPARAEELGRRLQREAFRNYLRSVPAAFAVRITRFALECWASEDPAGSRAWKERSNFSRVIPWSCYRRHMARAWEMLGRPRVFAPEHPAVIFAGARACAPCCGLDAAAGRG